PGTLPRVFIWADPPTPSEQFYGREGSLDQIAAMLAMNPKRPVQLRGAKGSGKSSIAYEYAVREQSRYDVVVKVASDNEDWRALEWCNLAHQLGLPAGDVETASAAIRIWMERHERWLIVFDNAENDSVLNLLPDRLRGDVLITAREDVAGPRAAD